jgi:hypothetical protein
MNIEFRKSFEKDLVKIRDEAVLQRIKAVTPKPSLARYALALWACALRIRGIQNSKFKVCPAGTLREQN